MNSDLIHWFDSCRSTNSELAAMAVDAPAWTVVATREQTAGRGQRGNTWEAEPGKNLTFSLLLRPDGIAAVNQFAVSEAVALGVADAIAEFLPDACVAVKWPNDIYVGSKKICGILIENVITGMNIDRSIVGVGINVNQCVWSSDAPNPVSMAEVAGAEFDLHSVLDCVLDKIQTYCSVDRCELHRIYLSRMWSHDRLTYRDTATGELFTAAIADVKPTGHLVLRDASGAERVYAFKEVAVVL